MRGSPLPGKAAERRGSMPRKVSGNHPLIRYFFEHPFGTETALVPPRRYGKAPSHPPPREALIRTLGVSLVAIAAVVASLTIVRQRQEEPARDKEKRPESSPAAVDLDLERLRAAGF